MEKLNVKLFTILLSSFYIFGFTAAFYNLQTATMAVFFLILSFGIIFFNFEIKKSIILYLILLFGIIRVQNLAPPDIFLSEIDPKEATIIGSIVSSKDVSFEKKRARFYIKVNTITFDDKTYDKLNSKVLVYLNYQDKLDKPIVIGDFVKLKGKLKTPKSATNPYQFDYKRYLFNNDCATIFYSKIENYEVLSSPKFSFSNFESSKLFILQHFEILRNKIIERHSKYIKSPKLEILGGIVFGNETINPDEKIKENFRNSGLLHLLAASGLNVALIFGIWWYIASLIRFPYNLTILSGALFVILYSFMTGFPPSILRAGVMLLFVLFGKLIDRTANSASLVFFAGFLILLFEPKMLFDVGFQLSFIVTFGLIITIPVITNKFKNIEHNYHEKFKNEFELKKQFFYLFSPVNLLSIVLIPFVAQIWVIPLQMHYFNNIAPYSILANIAIVPFIGVLSFLGFIGSIFALLPHYSEIIIRLFDMIADPLLALLIKISAIFASFKHSLIDTISLNAFQMFSFWLIILSVVLNIQDNFKNKKQNIFTLALIFIFLLSFIQFKSNNLEIAMFDVENADCFLIKTPKNKYIMIDTGKKAYHALSSFETVIRKYLLNNKIKTLEVLILTHYDQDHAGSAIEILKTHKVNLVIIQKESYSTQTETEILNYLKLHKINYKIAKNLETIYFEKDLNLKTLVPKDKNASDNETSIANLLTYKNRSVLFMADIGSVGYESIKNSIPEIDILKVGHHGAKGTVSIDMLNHLKPSYALISAGSNRYNHPDISTLDNLNCKNVKTILTKVSGFSKISIDKQGEISAFRFDYKNKKLKPLNLDEIKPPTDFENSIKETIEKL